MSKSPMSQKHVPPFLRRLGVSDSEWLYSVKGDLQMLMRPGWTLRVRITACIMLHTTGFKRDLAVFMRKGATPKAQPVILPMFPAAVRLALTRAAAAAFEESGVTAPPQLLKVPKTSVTRTLAELEEDDGFLVRVRANCPLEKLVAGGLTFKAALAAGLITPFSDLTPAERLHMHQRTCIYKRPRPEPATRKALIRKEDTSRNGLESETITKLPDIARGSIQMLLNFFPAEAAAAAYERPDVRDAITTYEAELGRAAAIEAEAKTKLRAFLSTINEAPATPEPAAAAPAPSNLRQLPPPAELEQLTAALNVYALADPDAAAVLLRRCRAVQPSCTVPEIAAALAARAPQASKAGNPVGFLLTACPKLFKGAAYEQLRTAARRDADTARRDAQRNAEREAESARMILEDPSHHAPEDVTWAQEFLTTAQGRKTA